MQNTARHAETERSGRSPSLRTLLVEGLTKSYGATVALDGVDLRVEAGTILGLLGPNGAGKTSLVSIVAGLRRPDAGRVEVCGIDVTCGHRSRPAASSGSHPRTPACTCRSRARQPAVLRRPRRALARRRRAERIDEVAGALGLTALLDRRATQLSGGERRRLHTAIALLHRPALVLLDEPTTGADVVTRTQILDLVRGLADDGSAVVYSTHYLQEIETLDADVAFIDRGRIVAHGSTAELVRPHGSSALELTFADAVPAAARVDGAVVDGTTVRIPAGDPAAACRATAPAPRRRRPAAELDRDRAAQPRVGVPHCHRPALRSEPAEPVPWTFRHDLGPAARRHPPPRAAALAARPAPGDGARGVPDHHDGVPEAGVSSRARAERLSPRQRRRAGRARPGGGGRVLHRGRHDVRVLLRVRVDDLGPLARESGDVARDRARQGDPAGRDGVGAVRDRARRRACSSSICTSAAMRSR